MLTSRRLLNIDDVANDCGGYIASRYIASPYIALRYIALRYTDTLIKADGDYGDTWGKLTPLRRVGQPSDVTDAVAFLASDAGSFITGQLEAHTGPTT